MLAKWNDHVVCYSCARKELRRREAAANQLQAASASSAASTSSAAAAVVRQPPPPSVKHLKKKRYVKARNRKTRKALTEAERGRYREKRKLKHDAWLETHTPQERIHRVLQCNTCGVVRHRDQHSCDNMLLLVLYALIKGDFTARPPYLDRATQ